MQVFKLYMKVLKKNLNSVFLYIGIFLLISVMMANNTSSVNSFKEIKLDVSVIDEDNTDASRALTEFIGESHNLVEIENDKDKILDALYYTQADYVLTINDGYEEKLINGETTGLFTNYRVHESYPAAILDNSVNEYASALRAYIAGGYDIDTALNKTVDTLSVDVNINTETFSEANTSVQDYPENFSYFFQYLPYIFLSILICSLCPVLLTLNQKELHNRTTCSSVPVSKQTFQIFIGSCVVVLVTWIVFMIAALILYGSMFKGKCWIAILNSFVLILVSAGISILVATFAPSKNVVNLIANVVGLGMSFLCGVFVPQNLLGSGVLRAARFLPAYWYIKVNNMLNGTSEEMYSASRCFSYIGIQAAFAIAIFAVILLVSKTKSNGK